MIFTATVLDGAYLIEPERIADDRGFFARTWCRQQFEERGLDFQVVQCNLSYNKRRGTLRGMHYQAAPFEEAKLVCCTRGSIYDAIIDLRRSSPSFKRHFEVILTAENHRLLYIPKGVAHGFQTLEDDTEVFYQMSEFYMPEYARGIRWNDPAWGIRWPIADLVMSSRDRAFPVFAGDGRTVS
jgi:dTDP-4-dehydrorhamnose 3,5-epimerase